MRVSFYVRVPISLTIGVVGRTPLHSINFRFFLNFGFVFRSETPRLCNSALTYLSRFSAVRDI